MFRAVFEICSVGKVEVEPTAVPCQRHDVQVRSVHGPIAIGSGLLAPLVAHTLDDSKIYDAFDNKNGRGEKRLRVRWSGHDSCDASDCNLEVIARPSGVERSSRR